MIKPPRIATALVLVPILVAAVALIALLNFNWNLARPWLNERAGKALNRPFTIAGDLTLTWEKQGIADREPGWRGGIPWPHLIAQDIHIGNPPTLTFSPRNTMPAEMIVIKQIEFSLNPFALLLKNIDIPILSLDAPVVSLQRNADGSNNWTFDNDSRPSPWQLNLRKVVFASGHLKLDDAIRHAHLLADIDALTTDPVYGIEWRMRGTIDGETVNGHGRAGAVLSLRQQTHPYPFMLRLHVGRTVISAEGVLTRPTDLAAIDMQLAVSGVSMGKLYALSGIYLPETPPFATQGHLSGTFSPRAGHWSYDAFSGTVGKSDIAGRLDYQMKQPRPLLSGSVVSHALHFSDLAPLIGADSNASKVQRGAATKQPADKMLPVEPFKTERWRSIDADIKFSADKIIRNKELPINKLMTKVHLQDGVMSLLPLNFGMAGGSVGSRITLDGSGKSGKNAIRANMNVTARHLKLKQLFPTVAQLQASAGEINGDAALWATGNSVASLLGAANGEIKTLINQGSISRLLLEEMGLNIGNVILTRIGGDKQIKLNCMATDFGVTDGMMQTRSFIVDTDIAIIDVRGNINLAQEQLNLTVNTTSKRMRVLSLRAPIYLRGSFKQPRVTVDRGVMAMKAGSAAALVILAPIAALIPLIKTGPGENSECAKLLADARIKPAPPPPGWTHRRKAAAK